METIAYAPRKICISRRPTAAFFRSESHINSAATMTAIAQASIDPKFLTLPPPVAKPTSAHDFSMPPLYCEPERWRNNYMCIRGERRRRWREEGGTRDVRCRRVVLSLDRSSMRTLAYPQLYCFDGEREIYVEIPELRHDVVGSAARWIGSPLESTFSSSRLVATTRVVDGRGKQTCVCVGNKRRENRRYYR